MDETYRDLKKVVEEKRKLYKRITKHGLRDEGEDYLRRVREDVNEVEGRTTPHSVTFSNEKVAVRSSSDRADR